jgi:hypothetical protein
LSLSAIFPLPQRIHTLVSAALDTVTTVL